MAEQVVAFTPKAQQAVEAWRESKRAFARGRTQDAKSEKLACEIYEELTGVKLPQVYPFTDPETGEMYEIHLHAEVRPVQRGVPQDDE